VKYDATDLLVRSALDMSSEVKQLLSEIHGDLRGHIDKEPSFLTALEPMTSPAGAPEIVREMCESARLACVGPMASVAGAVAEAAGRLILSRCPEAIVENGGDLWMSLAEPAAVTIFSGNIHFRDSVALSVRAENTPCGICTSSGRFGHSLNFGRADTVTVIADTGALADAAATAAGNMVRDESCLTGACDRAMSIAGVRGIVVIFGDRLAAQGEVEFTG
jgi:ApbE superfamily uncharacterized protein (UPF0280 family)